SPATPERLIGSWKSDALVMVNPVRLRRATPTHGFGSMRWFVQVERTAPDPTAGAKEKAARRPLSGSRECRDAPQLPPDRTVTARRFCDQHEMLSQTATGRSLP